jgi:hypothetical protein
MFQQKPEDRLRSWREFRASLDLLPLDQALAQTAEYWVRAPFTPYNLDPDLPHEWPDPWTLIMENSYCDVAKCLGIVYTILLTEHRKDLEIELRQYEDPTNRHVFNLAWVNKGKYILNMIDGEVVNIKHIDKTLKIKKQYSEVDLQLENY